MGIKKKVDWKTPYWSKLTMELKYTPCLVHQVLKTKTVG
jgi:hypothetical protein